MDIKSVKLPWDNIAFDVISRDGEVNPYLRSWLERHQIELATIRSKYGLSCERNASVEFFLDKTVRFGVRNLCLLDRDMYPLRETEAILTAPGDLVYCGYTSQKGCLAHYGDKDLGAGCMRVSTKVLRAIKPPWFEFEYNKKGTAITLCECRYFLRKAEAAGFQSKMVGVVGHLSEMVVRPDPEDPTKIQVKWPDNLS